MTEGLAALPRSSQSIIAWSMVVCPSKSDRGFNLQEIFSMSLSDGADPGCLKRRVFPHLEISIGQLSHSGQAKELQQRNDGYVICLWISIPRGVFFVDVVLDTSFEHYKPGQRQ
jgi:hypothetical protein